MEISNLPWAHYCIERLGDEHDWPDQLINKCVNDLLAANRAVKLGEKTYCTGSNLIRWIATQ